MESMMEQTPCSDQHEQPRFSPVKKPASSTMKKQTKHGESEWLDFREPFGEVPWIWLACLFGAVAWLSRAFSSAADTIDDMMIAYEDDVPAYTMPTRNQSHNLPTIGRAFQLSCDLGDVLSSQNRHRFPCLACLYIHLPPRGFRFRRFCGHAPAFCHSPAHERVTLLRVNPFGFSRP